MPENPFHTPTPENLSAKEMVRLFVPEFKDFHAVKANSHTIISGPRGTGKSSILRYMQVDCQKEENECSFKELSWVGILVKFSGPANLPEMKRLAKLMGHAYIMITEHSLVLEVLGSLVEMLNSHINETEKKIQLSENDKQELADVFIYSDKNVKSKILTEEIVDVDFVTVCLKEFLQNNMSYLLDYLGKLINPNNDHAFEGKLISYNDLLYPLLKVLRKSTWTPDAPIYLLFDDADSLGSTAISIINSWISMRTTNEVCIKLATLQKRYPTYISTRGKRIEAPHDYYEFSVREIYTTNFETYQKRITKIVDKRLSRFYDGITARDFFPSDKVQDTAIEKIRKDYLNQDSPRGYRAGDDAYRYAIADYIKELSATSAKGSGSRKQGSKFKYAGFEWLIHISSGNTRDFLNAAHEMYNKELENNDNKEPPTSISSQVQDKCIRQFSEKFLEFDFYALDSKLNTLLIGDQISQAEELQNPTTDQLKKLSNLIETLGGIFRLQLRSDYSERRVFSIAFTDGPDEEVQQILDIGVVYGYLQASTIGNKEGTGRVPLYILSRRLAPYFGLDPTGFAGYKFIKNSVVKAALHRPKICSNEGASKA